MCLTNLFPAYGHISVRNPQNPSTFFVSKSLAPALVSCREDIEEYKVSDAIPVNPDAPKGYSERFIHSEIYKKYSDVHCVIHSHAEAVVPYSIASTPLRPVLHVGGTMGAQVPVYDIALHYRTSDSVHSLLVVNEHLGAALAAGMNPSTTLGKTVNVIKNFVTSAVPQEVAYPSNPTILMRGHGFTCVGDSVSDAVYRAVYTCTNARVQTTSLLMQGTFNIGRIGERFGAGEKDNSPAKQEGILYLSDRECKDTRDGLKGSQERPWKLWCAEVEHASLYRNELGSPPGA